MKTCVYLNAVNEACIETSAKDSVSRQIYELLFLSLGGDGKGWGGLCGCSRFANDILD